MNFKLNMSEITSLVRTFIEEQYGRRTGTVTFTSNSMKPSGHDDAILVEVADLGPMPDESGADSATAEPSGMSGAVFPLQLQGHEMDLSILNDEDNPIGLAMFKRLGLHEPPAGNLNYDTLFLRDPGDGGPLQLLTLADMDARVRDAATEDA